MTKIEPMTVEQFFAETKPRFDGDKLDLRIRPNDDPKDNGGGWVAASNHACAMGDTIEEAIRAVHDHLMRNPSKRSRLNPPYFTSDFEAKNWKMCQRINYDYRAKDWEPPNNTTEVDHELRLDQMNRARRRLTGVNTCEDGKTAIAECTEHYCKTSGRCSLAMQDYTNRKEGKQ